MYQFASHVCIQYVQTIAGPIAWLVSQFARFRSGRYKPIFMI